jgi:ribose 5-phosphate isomerase A
MDPKQRAAEAALNYIHSNTTIGLGTGSTADFFLIALADALRTGKLRNVRGVPTSTQSERRATKLGIPLTTLAQCPHLDLTVDGADEISPTLDLIKGLGGALLREKIVAQNSRRLIIVADSSKRVQTLGTKAALPIEVAPFGHEAHEPFLKSLGGTPKLRTTADGKPFVTDNHNYIYDCRFPAIPHPDVIEAALARRAGLVEWGLFLGMASIALIADDTRVETLQR